MQMLYESPTFGAQCIRSHAILSVAIQRAGADNILGDPALPELTSLPLPFPDTILTGTDAPARQAQTPDQTRKLERRGCGVSSTSSARRPPFGVDAPDVFFGIDVPEVAFPSRPRISSILGGVEGGYG